MQNVFVMQLAAGDVAESVKTVNSVDAGNTSRSQDLSDASVAE